MIDRETAEQGLDALSVAIGELLEDHSAIAVTKVRTKQQRIKSARAFAVLGEDVATLAAAMQVLIRHSAETPKNRLD